MGTTTASNISNTAHLIDTVSVASALALIDTSCVASACGLESITEHREEDINGIYIQSSNSTIVALCLDELVLPVSSVDTNGVSKSDIWKNIEVAKHFADQETIMWDHMSKYVDKGNEYIKLINDKKWFRG